MFKQHRVLLLLFLVKEEEEKTFKTTKIRHADGNMAAYWRSARQG